MSASAPRRRRRSRREPWLWWRIEYAALVAVFWVLRALPLRVAMATAAALAAFVIRVARPLRRVGRVNLRLAFPERSDADRDAILVASYRNLGRMIAECAHLQRLTPRNVREVVGFEDETLWRSELALQLGESGVLVLTGHFGNWELFAYAHGLLGYPVHLVRQTIKNPLIDAFVDRIRTRGGTRTLRKHGAARSVLRTIAEKGLMVLPLDQNASGRTGIFVDYFGVPASTNAGFARIALRSGAPVYPAFLVREGTTARHRIFILPRVPASSMADREQATREFTQRCTLVLEAMIRRHPDHWLWTHKRWRTRPDGEPGLYES